MLCSIWYHLYNLKRCEKHPNMKTLKVALLHGCFSRFLYKWDQIAQNVSYETFPMQILFMSIIAKRFKHTQGLT